MKSTPWGQAQHSKELAEGITIHSTSSHGGIELDLERQHQLKKIMGVTKSPNFLRSWRWWEEDGDAVFVIVAFSTVGTELDPEGIVRMTQFINSKGGLSGYYKPKPQPPQRKRAIEPEPEYEYGGTFDGYSVTSDADPGL